MRRAFSAFAGRACMLLAAAVAVPAGHAGPPVAPPGCFFGVHGDVVCPPPPPEVPARLDPGTSQAARLPLPPGASRGGEVGVVVDLAPDGRVLDVSIERSSRERTLDRAALAHAATLRYLPAFDAGRAIASRLRVAVAFDPALPPR